MRISTDKLPPFEHPIIITTDGGYSIGLRIGLEGVSGREVSLTARTVRQLIHLLEAALEDCKDIPETTQAPTRI